MHQISNVNLSLQKDYNFKGANHYGAGKLLISNRSSRKINFGFLGNLHFFGTDSRQICFLLQPFVIPEDN